MSSSAPSPPKQLPSLASAAWLKAPEARAVFAALAAGGAETRAVGGSVRNALFGLPVKDVDLATTALPADVMRLAEKAGLKAIPTGIEHGTVTIVSGHVPFEVTTLRRDIETFGRHAVVTFTTDWAEDARRRDFTMNALYASADGTLHDPLQGYPDLAARRVRFIGNPHERIREDYLRILRFFRLFAEYGEGPPDAESLAAAISERQGLAKLSGERLATEVLRLLAAPRAVEAVHAMAEGHVLEVLSRHPAPRKVERLAAIEAHLGRAPDPVLRLAAMFVLTAEDAERIGERLKLSRADRDTLASVADKRAEDHAFVPEAPEQQARLALYRLGAPVYVNRALIAWATGHADVADTRRRERLELPLRWQAPAPPFSGRDVIALGVPAGRSIGKVLSAFEAWWIAADFPSDPAELKSALARVARDAG
jgi:poly(A) polymerase